MANKSVLIAVAACLAFALTPAFINAQTANAPAIVGSNCFIKVYHTNFAFPPEGGQIVQIGSENFFWRNYLPNCMNALPNGAQVVGAGPSQSQVTYTNLTGSYGTQLAGSPCAVRVYHTNFAFPPEGGQVVRIGQELFFIRSYRPECASAGIGGTVVATGTQVPKAQQAFTPVQPVTQSVPTPTPQVCY